MVRPVLGLYADLCRLGRVQKVIDLRYPRSHVVGSEREPGKSRGVVVVETRRWQ